MKQKQSREKLSQGCLLGTDLSLCCRSDNRKAESASTEPTSVSLLQVTWD